MTPRLLVRDLTRLVALVICVATVEAQQTPAAAMPTGDGVIVGQVVDASSGTPIGGVTVTLAIMGARTSVACDAQGRFVFSNLAAGQFSLSATQPGYIGGHPDQRFPTDGGRPIDLAKSEHVTDVRLRLWKLAVIAGKVEDAAGEPLVGVTVRALQKSLVGGQVQFTADGTTTTRATTDDHGNYRLAGLTPGVYVVAVPSSDQQRPSPAQTFPTVFYLSSLSASGGTVLTLTSGEEKLGVDVKMAATPMFSVSGKIVSAEAVPSGVRLELVRAESDKVLTNLDLATTSAAADGHFAFSKVPAGQYTIRVLRLPSAQGLPTARFSGNGSGFTSVGGPLPTPGTPMLLGPLPETRSLWADASVTVQDKNPDDVTLALRPGARISGRIVFEGALPRPTSDELQASPIFLVPIDGREAMSQSGRIEADGTFTTGSVAPGEYVLFTFLHTRGWGMKSTLVDGRESAGSPIEIGTKDITDVVMTMTDQSNVLSGVVKGADEKPQSDASIFVFSANRDMWKYSGSMLTPLLREVRPGRAGAYQTSLVPGQEYFVAAVTGEVPEFWATADFLEPLTKFAVKVRLDAGEKGVLDLKARPR